MNHGRRTHQESKVRGSNPDALTALLYQQVLRDLGRASEAMSQRRVDVYSRELNHASAVIGYLQAILNPSAGVPRNLAGFYTMLRERMMEAQLRCSRDILEELRKHMIELRGAPSASASSSPAVSQR